MRYSYTVQLDTRIDIYQILNKIKIFLCTPLKIQIYRHNYNALKVSFKIIFAFFKRMKNYILSLITSFILGNEVVYSRPVSSESLPLVRHMLTVLFVSPNQSSVTWHNYMHLSLPITHVFMFRSKRAGICGNASAQSRLWPTIEFQDTAASVPEAAMARY